MTLGWGQVSVYTPAPVQLVISNLTLIVNNLKKSKCKAAAEAQKEKKRNINVKINDGNERTVNVTDRSSDDSPV